MLITSSCVYVAEAYLFNETYTAMKKLSNGEIIYVFSASVDKLILRNYANVVDELRYQCINETTDPHSGNCKIKRDGNTLCIFVMGVSDICIEKFDKPASHKDCKALFKLASEYFVVMYEEHWHYSNYPAFAFLSCDLPNEDFPIYDYTGYATIDYQIANNAEFLARNGIPSTIDWKIGGIEDTDPPRISGRGSFSSHDQSYNFKFFSQRNYIELYCIFDYEETRHDWLHTCYRD